MWTVCSDECSCGLMVQGTKGEVTFDGAEIVTEVNESYSTPVGPMYEEVGPATPTREMDIELQSNQAYSQPREIDIELQSNQAYSQVRR